MAGMKRRIIKRTIEAKLNAWLKTMPPELKTQVEGHLIVTGGCIASMLLGEPVNDYDVYCDDVNTAAALAKHYVDVFNEKQRTKIPCVKFITNADGSSRVVIYIKSYGVVGEDSGEDSGEDLLLDTNDIISIVQQETKDEKVFRPVFLSENAITLSDKIQIVIRFTGSPEAIHKNYDYIHATNFYYSGTQELVLNPAALESLLSKTLRYQGSLYPICSLFRMRKFMDRGWTISAGEITKMALQISELDLHDPLVLREQLIGVDSVYFQQLVRRLVEFQASNPGIDIDTLYVINLIDELFN